MRVRHLGLAAFALIMAASSEANAQKKPKRPKKPKTEQPKEDVPDTRDTRDPPDHPPPPTDTTLKETAPLPAPRTAPPPPKPAPSTWLSRPLMVGVYGGYASENLRLALGMRAGYSLFDVFYIGVAFTYQLGVVIGDVTFRGFYPALEGGYEWHIDAITIRPYAGIALYFAQVSGAGVSDTGGGYFSLYPGLSGDYQIANTPGFVGVDARLLLIFGAETHPNPSIGLFALGGMRF